MKVERYCGVQLSDHLGVLVVMDEHPMRDIEFIEDIVGPSQGGRQVSIFQEAAGHPPCTGAALFVKRHP